MRDDDQDSAAPDPLTCDSYTGVGGWSLATGRRAPPNALRRRRSVRAIRGTVAAKYLSHAATSKRDTMSSVDIVSTLTQVPRTARAFLPRNNE